MIKRLLLFAMFLAISAHAAHAQQQVNGQQNNHGQQSAQSQPAAPGYHIVKRLPVDGEGGWDYLAIDGAARRMYLARGTHVMVVDIDADQVVGDIPDTPGVHGVALAPELNRGFTSNGRANTSTIFDLKTLKVIGLVWTGADPDAIVYDADSKRVLTFNGRGKNATIFEARTGKVVKTLPLGGKPEYAVADGKGKVFVNLTDLAEVVEIDSHRARVVRRFSIRPCESPTGMAIDTAKKRIFSGCRNRVMTVLDVDSGKVIAGLPIGDYVDGNGFDAGLAFSSNGDGTLTVAGSTGKDSYQVLETVKTEWGARTMAIDPVTHRLYLPVGKVVEQKAPGRGNRQAEIVKESFQVLVFSK